MIELGIDIFSYDPCLLYVWIGKEQTNNKGIISINCQMKGVTCENLFFYLMEEYNVIKRLENNLYKSEYENLMNINLSTDNELNKIIPSPQSKKKKEKLVFDHNNNDNYRIGCCFHYFRGQ
jgi:hypothetical protein